MSQAKATRSSLLKLKTVLTLFVQLTPWNVDTLSKPGFEKTVSGCSVQAMSEIAKAFCALDLETNQLTNKAEDDNLRFSI